MKSIEPIGLVLFGPMVTAKPAPLHYPLASFIEPNIRTTWDSHQTEGGALQTGHSDLHLISIQISITRCSTCPAPLRLIPVACAREPWPCNTLGTPLRSLLSPPSQD